MMIVIGGMLVLASFGAFMLPSPDDDDDDPEGIRPYRSYEGFSIVVMDDWFWIGYNIPGEDAGLYIGSQLTMSISPMRLH